MMNQCDGNKLQKEQNKQIEKQLKLELDEPRFEHTMGVAYTAAALAMCYDCSIEDAFLAGLLHDCAKCIPNKNKIQLCEENGIEITTEERSKPSLLHAKLGAFLAKEKYQVTDTSILQSILRHTTGAPDMTLLDKIIYLADYIEPGRDQAPNLQLVRKLAFEDLDLCILKVLEDTLEYLNGTGEVIDPMTELTYLYYKKEVKK